VRKVQRRERDLLLPDQIRPFGKDRCNHHDHGLIGATRIAHHWKWGGNGASKKHTLKLWDDTMLEVVMPVGFAFTVAVVVREKKENGKEGSWDFKPREEESYPTIGQIFMVHLSRCTLIGHSNPLHDSRSHQPPPTSRYGTIDASLHIQILPVLVRSGGAYGRRVLPAAAGEASVPLFRTPVHQHNCGRQFLPDARDGAAVREA